MHYNLTTEVANFYFFDKLHVIVQNSLKMSINKPMFANFIFLTNNDFSLFLFPAGFNIQLSSVYPHNWTRSEN